MSWTNPNIGLIPIAEMSDADLITAANLLYRVACMKMDCETFEFLKHPQATELADPSFSLQLNQRLTSQPELPPLYTKLAEAAAARGIAAQLVTERGW